MKKQIIPITFLFAAILMLGSISSANAQSNIIGKPVPIPIQYTLQVAQNDFPNQMNWADAKKACEALGEGWRLPTIEELNFMYNIKDTLKMSGFSWWSSTVYDDKVYYKDFKNNNFLTNENYRFGFRVVRDIKLPTLNIIGKPFIMNSINGRKMVYLKKRLNVF